MRKNFINETENLIIHQISVFTDNYIYIAQIKNTKEVFVIDPGESKITLDYLKRNGLEVKWYLITHEHYDHIGGLQELMNAFPASKVICNPKLDFELNLKAKDKLYDLVPEISLNGVIIKLIELPGHTKTHMAFHCLKDKVIFCGDILFGLGCGRIISGTYEQQFETMFYFKQLTDDMRIFCAHEYTMRNYQFLKSNLQYFPEDLQKYYSKSENSPAQILVGIEVELSTRERTVPLSLGNEKRTNPFLISKNLSDFRTVRELRNRF